MDEALMVFDEVTKQAWRRFRHDLADRMTDLGHGELVEVTASRSETTTRSCAVRPVWSSAARQAACSAAWPATARNPVVKASTRVPGVAS